MYFDVIINFIILAWMRARNEIELPIIAKLLIFIYQRDIAWINFVFIVILGLLANQISVSNESSLDI